MKSTLFTAVMAVALISLAPAAIADYDQAVVSVQDHWAQANYDAQGKERKKAFKSLVQEADKMVGRLPDSAEAHIWAGIVYSTYAGEVSMFSAGKQVKRARQELERAMEIDAGAMNGSAYTSLGALLYQIPGLMGGDDEKAEEMLIKGIELNQDGIDSNYFYGAFLIEQDRMDEAREYLQKALAAPPRPGRERADQGRRDEIMKALEEAGSAGT